MDGITSFPSSHPDRKVEKVLEYQGVLHTIHMLFHKCENMHPGFDNIHLVDIIRFPNGFDPWIRPFSSVRISPA